jgi:hypothetical protein
MEVWMIIEKELPPLNEDIEDLLIRQSNDYKKKQSDWKGSYYITTGEFKGIDIYKIKYSFLFSYYLEDVGLVPFWYKSKKDIDVLWNKFKTDKEIQKEQTIKKFKPHKNESI